MFKVIFAVVTILKPRQQLCLEILALRHQVHVLRRGVKRPALNNADRLLWVGFMKMWPEWRNCLVIVRPETAVGWRRKAFRVLWRWKSRPRGGRPSIDPDIIHLTRRMWKPESKNRLAHSLRAVSVISFQLDLIQIRPRLERHLDTSLAILPGTRLEVMSRLQLFLKPGPRFSQCDGCQLAARRPARRPCAATAKGLKFKRLRP
jgi:hypothetical protein